MTFSLRNKLLIVFFGAAMLMVVLVGGMTMAIRDLVASVQEMERLAARTALTDRLQLELSRLLVPLNNYVLTGDVRHRDVFDRSVVEISHILNRLQHSEGQEEWSVIARDVNDRVVELATVAVDVLFIEQPVGNAAVIEHMREVTRRAEELITKASHFHQLAEINMASQEQSAAARSAHVNRLMTALFILVPIALAAFYLILARWVTQPLLSLHRGVLNLNAGKAARIPILAHDEIGEVGQAFNDLIENLSASREQVQQYTRQLEALYTASRALSKESSRDVLYQTLTDLARTLTESQYAALVIFNDEEQPIQVVESGASPFPHVPEQRRQAILGTLPHSRRPVRISDGRNDGRLQGLPCDQPIATFLGVPILAEASLRAQLYVMQKSRGVFTDGDEDLVVTIAHDAAQSLKVIGLHEETERMATIDGLTGFINRWAFEDRLAEEFLKADRHARQFALIFIDLDHLKEINDRFGHAHGDAAIRRFCDAIRASIRATEIVGRYGGDEILVLMPETSLADGCTVAERILRRLTGLPLVVEHERIVLTASLGVAAYPEHGRDKEALLRAADYALYQAKALGRGRVYTFHPPDAVTVGGEKSVRARQV